MRRRIIPDVVHDQDVLFLPAEATVADACRAMKRRHVGCVLVTDRGHLCGIFTERDVVNRVVAADLDAAKTPLAAVMTRDPDTIEANTSPIEALRMMQDRGYRHLPVIAGDCVVGIVSRRDFLGDEKMRLEEETHYWQRI
jgi:CBS domain-containing protein